VITLYLSKAEEFHYKTTSKHVLANAATCSSVFQTTCTSAKYRLCGYNVTTVFQLQRANIIIVVFQRGMTICRCKFVYTHMHVCMFTKSMFFSYRKNGKISVKLTSIGWKHRIKEPMKDSKESNGQCSDLKNAAEMKAIPLTLLFNKEKT
jgi:hypothetical protein